MERGVEYLSASNGGGDIRRGQAIAVSAFVGGCMYVLFSTESDLDLLGNLISHAGFAARLVAERSILIESMIIYELRMQ